MELDKVTNIDSVDDNDNFEFLKNYPDLNKYFIFAYPVYNFRSTEINAVLGINQIKRLNTNNKRRVGNFSYFIKNIDNKQ